MYSSHFCLKWRGDDDDDEDDDDDDDDVVAIQSLPPHQQPMSIEHILLVAQNPFFQ